MILKALLRKEFLALHRDPHALTALFIMPLVFIVIMSLVLKDMYSKPASTLSYGIELQEANALTRAFAKEWQLKHGAPVTTPAEQFAANLQSSRLAYVLVLKPGFAQALSATTTPATPVVQLISEPGLNTNLWRALNAELAGAVGELRASVLVANILGVSVKPEIAPFISSSGQKSFASAPSVNAVQQNVPAWLAFGMFFVVTAISSLFVQEQRDGTLARLLSMGVSTNTLIAAKALPYFAINALQALLMLAVGMWLMPHLGGDALSLKDANTLALLGMLFSISVAAIGFSLLLACLVRTHAQANTLGPFCNILMAGIGGIMVPTFVMPNVMKQLAGWSPLNWSLEGLLAVLVRHADLSATMPWAARLLAFGLISFLLARVLFLRRLHH
jgi:ABC-2 type transport system permease protein